jgi:endonuclease/exonuclease/phosphatase family metal-dependent hydrolase
MNVVRFLLLASLAWCSVAAGSPPHTASEPASGRTTQPSPTGSDAREGVLLLHGLGLGSWAMKQLEWSLERAGYRVINASYPSRTLPLEDLAGTWLPQLLEREGLSQAPRVHVVTHSMGGILLRGFLADSARRPANLGRVVMIAPPNQGSVVVDQLESHWIFRAATGVNGVRLGTNADAYPQTIGPWNPAIELGVIAGDRSLNPWFSRWHEGPNDGKVSVASSRLPGMREHLVMHHSHTWLQYRGSVNRQVVTFLREGRFDPEGPKVGSHERFELASTCAVDPVSRDASQPAAPAAAAGTLAVMTYNLRYASDRPPHAWPARRPAMAQRLREVAPDIIGTQEGVYGQIKDIATDLPEFEWIGLGREGGSRGEFMAVFYRRARLEPLEYDHFWLSDTPSVIASATWGHSNRRMVTWVRFLDRETGKRFVLLNTHFDHQVQFAREQSAALIRDRLAAWGPEVPVIVTGDFNAVAGANCTYEILTQGGALNDTWQTARARTGDPTLNTYTGYEPNPRRSERIDWILTRPGIETDRTEILNWTTEVEQPSDHLPVMAWLRLP